MKQVLPRSDIQIDGAGDGVILTGTAASPIEAQQAGDLAARLTGSVDKVVNAIVVRGRGQVMLKVTVAEMSRSIVKQLGIDLSTSLNSGTSTVSLTNSNPFTAYGSNLVSGNNATLSIGGTTATLRAMETAGVMRTLAEPPLTAISGESATFVSGGEFPVPAGYSPFIVRAVAPRQIARSDDGFVAPSDPEANLLGNINRIYGLRARREPTSPRSGDVGFIVD